MKLNLGAGSDIRIGWINHDIHPIEGINVVHDLNLTPWPWESESFEYILAKDVVEHLDNFSIAMHELWRISRPGSLIHIRVPYMGSWSFYADPTHIRAFHETTFEFFDPRTEYGRSRSYYSEAKFEIVEYSFICAPFIPYFTIPKISEIRVTNSSLKKVLGFLNMFILKNIIQDLEVSLKRVEPENH
jgi:hypothetical protein